MSGKRFICKIISLTGKVKSVIIGEIMGKRANRKRKQKKEERRSSTIIVRRGDKNVSKQSNVFAGCGCKPAVAPKQVGFVPQGARTITIKPEPEPSFWETDIEVEMVKSCGVFDDKIEVMISAKARQKMNLLMRKFPRLEWLAYLTGDKDELFVDDIVIPKQRVTSVNVYVDEGVSVPIIGVIHSHHDMGNGFSHTDDSYINQNHDLSLCITNQKITGQARVKTECGRFMLVDVEVVDAIEGFEVDDFIKEIEEQISEKTIVHTYPGVGGNIRGSHYPNFGNNAGYADLDEEDDVWDTLPPSAGAPTSSKEILSEVRSYHESIQGAVMDDFFMIEFNMLYNLINSIGTDSYGLWEDKAFDDGDNVYTENYYRLIDEISLFQDDLTSQEKTALLNLSKELEKRCETNLAN